MWKRRERERVLRVLQTNVGTARLAHDLAVVSAIEKEIDNLIAAEPNPTLVRSREWFVDTSGVVGVQILNRKLRVHGIDTHQGFVTIRVVGVNVVGCYISPNCTVENYESRLDEIMNEVRLLGMGRECVVLGDFKSKATEWDYPRTDARGQMLMEWIGTLDLVVLSNGREATFVRGNSHLYIDVTCATQNAARKIRDWTVLPDDTATEHRYIGFSIVGVGTTNVESSANQTGSRGGDRTDWLAFDKYSRWLIEGRRCQPLSAEGLESIIRETMRIVPG
ncbi:uncharacterized protein [Diabrotica undecimpunctata]|uniref:uncharacterized protein n=1 Tax=Diabrotica undecimpunctata TaxID=50387 RepID=UPI003B63EB0D